MGFWFCWVLVLLGNVSAGPPRYSIHHATANFDQAAKDCSPGSLAALPTEQEVKVVLGLVSEAAAALHQSELTLWVGLRKVKDECVVPSLPLRGFKWTEDGGEDSELIRWAEDPKHTCTTVRCAALKAELHGTNVTRWGLIPVSCRTSFGSICKLRDQDTAGTPGPDAPESEPTTPEPEAAKPGPATPGPEAATPEPEPAKPGPEAATPEPGPATPGPELITPGPDPPTPATQKPEPAEPELSTRGPEPEPDLTHGTGSEVQGPGPGPGPGPASDSCEQPYVPGSRFITLDRDNASRVLVECYSVRLEVHCSGRPASWHLPDGSPANFSTMCLPCDAGFGKDASGHCVDTDECGGAPCRHSCLNTVGSFRCFCTDGDGTQHDEDSPECTVTEQFGSGILVPVLAGVAALLLLVVVVAVAVKCCLMRRKKRALEAEKSDGKDSFETANEKAAT